MMKPGNNASVWARTEDSVKPTTVIRMMAGQLPHSWLTCTPEKSSAVITRAPVLPNRRSTTG